MTKNLWRRILPACAACLALALPAALAGQGSPDLDFSTRKDALSAINQGLQYLRAQQHADGSWSRSEYPAITALATRALLEDPEAVKTGIADPIAIRGLGYVVSCVQKDGGIYCTIPKERGGSLQNYNTAAALETLGVAHETQYFPLIRSTRRYLASLQHLEKDAFYGGWGYDIEHTHPRSDMTNTGFTIAAFHATEYVEKAAPQEEAKPAAPAGNAAAASASSDDPNWAAAETFLSHCQNLATAAEKDRATSNRAEDFGGFFYNPEGSNANPRGGVDAQGRPIWYSYGNATALGLACLLESGLKKDDPRVTGAVNWLRSNFDLNEHPGGLGKEGVYFYYHSLASALALYGEDPLKRADGQPPIRWRRELVLKLLSLQRVDPKTGYGYWVNDEGRWMENDPVLVTAYCTLALETLVKEPAAEAGSM